MRHEIIIAGFGGQGIMLMGQLLAYGAIFENHDVTFYPSYGPEMRGGTANCTVVISNERIGSPIRSSYSLLIAMNQASVERFESRIKPGGLAAYNSSLISQEPLRADIASLGIPANRIASAMGNAQAANMVALGSILPFTEGISIESLCEGLPHVLPEHRHFLIPDNRAALEGGLAYALEDRNRPLRQPAETPVDREIR